MNNDGCNALHLLAKSASPEKDEAQVFLTLWLIARGGDVHAKDKHNCLPLHYAAASGSTHLVLKFLFWAAHQIIHVLA